MKKRKSIFTLFTLFFFISSLLFSAFISYAFTLAARPDCTKHEIVAKTTTEVSCARIIFIEKDSSETEDGCNAQEFVTIQFNLADETVTERAIPHFDPPAVSTSNPIYLSVRNFRI